MLYLQIASPKSSVLNFLDSNSFEVIISIFQRTEKVPDMERLHPNGLDSSFSSIRRGQKDSIPICRTLIQHAAFRAVIASSRFTFTSVSPS